MNPCGVCTWVQVKMLEALKLEFQVPVTLLVWVLGMELKFFCKSTRCSPIAEPSFVVCCFGLLSLM